MSDSGDDSGDERADVLKKRPRTATDALIQSALLEEESRKKSKKGPQEAKPAKKKDGKTLAEIEEEEGGPIKESLVGMAQVKRAAGRKAKDKEADDTGIPTDVDKYEEAAEVDEEEGIKFTGFNLAEERETGFFDEEGNYVERKEKDPTSKDAWLTSDEAKVVSDEVRRKIEDRQKAAEQAARSNQAPMTDRQIAALKQELMQHMQNGETLTKALKRLGAGQQAARAMGKREKQRLQQQQQQQKAGSQSDEKQGTAEVFARMTEIAADLMQEGETDVYDSTREEFERFVRMWMPKQAAGGPPQAAQGHVAGPGPAAGKPAASAGAGAAAVQDDEDEDMFGDDEPSSKAKPPTAAGKQSNGEQQQHQGAGEQRSVAKEHAAVGTPASEQAPQQPPKQQQQQQGTEGIKADEDEDVYSTWPVKELKRFLKERGVDPESCVEKQELVQRVRQLAAAGPVTTATTATTAAGAYTAPLGFAFDPASGYYLHAETGMYFDSSSGYFYKDGTWYTMDGSGGYVPVPA